MNREISKRIAAYPRLHNMLRGLLLLFSSRSYLKTTGYFSSLKHGKPCRPDGSPVPWMNFPVISFLDRRLTKEMRLFEYGSGYSSLYYAKLTGKVVSVEHERSWYEKMASELPENASLMYVAFEYDGDYCKTVHTAEASFHVVIIDGRDRVRCLKNAVTALTDDGVVILDDSQRLKYTEAFTFMKEHGFKAIDFEGIKPCGYIVERTTIFYREQNCLGL